MLEKVIFLDIEGVLQPGTQVSFEHIRAGDVPELYKELAQRTGVDYNKHNIYDVTAVYYDWEDSAVNELRRILDTTGAKIVLSSSWKENGFECMRDLMHIYDLHDYLVDFTPTIEYGRHLEVIKELQLPERTDIRSVEILSYLHDHPEVKYYVVIDDIPLGKDLGEHFVEIYPSLTEELADVCIKTLQIRRGTARSSCPRT